MAYDPETGRTEQRRVIRTFVHEDKPTYEVVLDDGEKVTSTAEHPFMVDGKGWTPLSELEKGDLLLGPGDLTVEVQSINATGEVSRVYNVEVEGLHSYYVAVSEHWVLVHNINEECTRLIYRGGTRTDGNLTPRPDSEDITTGLSAHTRLEGAARPGGKYAPQRTVAVQDSASGHVSIKPRDGGSIETWAGTRDTHEASPYTQDIRDALVGEGKVPKG